MGNSQNGARAIGDLAFTNLLASAYSLQQWQDQRNSAASASNSDELIGVVLDTQGLVWRHAVHPETAMQLIANRSQKLCGAAGSAVAFLNGENLAYTVATGIAARMLGCKFVADSSSSFRQLRSESVVESDTWADKALGAYVVAASILSVPIRRKGRLAGCFHLFSRHGHFNEQSKGTCELMSAILGQLIEESEILEFDSQVQGTILRSGEKGESKLPEKAAGILPNSSELLSRPGKVEDPPSDLTLVKANGRRRVQTMLYPACVLLFVVLANIYTRGYAWPVDIGTVIIFMFTVVELTKRRRRPHE